MKSSRILISKQIKLQEKIVPYKTIFSRRAKYIRLQINHSNELEVIIPRRYKHEKAEAFILQKKDWILKHLQDKQINKFYFLGEKISVFVNYDLFLKKPQVYFQDKILTALIPSGDSFSQEDIYNVWLKHKANDHLTERVKNISDRTGLIYKNISIRSQKTRWGSCSAGKKVSFNYKLMKFRKEVIDYVIIHELCHLKEMNHSQKFWRLVEDYCPAFKKLKKELK